MTTFWLAKLVSAAVVLAVWGLAVRRYRRDTAAAAAAAIEHLEGFASTASAVPDTAPRTDHPPSHGATVPAGT
jgi:hypothetical protein